MKFTGSRALTVVSVAVAAVVLAACGKKEVVSTELIVKIGHVGPVSGAIAHLGKDNENGARMAIEELNAAGLKIGDEASAGFSFQLGDRIISCERNSLEESVFVRIKVRWIPAEILGESRHPAFGIMAEIGHEHTGCEVE